MKTIPTITVTSSLARPEEKSDLYPDHVVLSSTEEDRIFKVFDNGDSKMVQLCRLHNEEVLHTTSYSHANNVMALTLECGRIHVIGFPEDDRFPVYELVPGGPKKTLIQETVRFSIEQDVMKRLSAGVKGIHFIESGPSCVVVNTVLENPVNGKETELVLVHPDRNGKLNRMDKLPGIKSVHKLENGVVLVQTDQEAVQALQFGDIGFNRIDIARGQILGYDMTSIYVQSSDTDYHQTTVHRYTVDGTYTVEKTTWLECVHFNDVVIFIFMDEVTPMEAVDGNILSVGSEQYELSAPIGLGHVQANAHGDIVQVVECKLSEGNNHASPLIQKLLDRIMDGKKTVD